MGCVVRIVVDSMLPHTEYGPNDHRKDAPPFISFEKRIFCFSYKMILSGSRLTVNYSDSYSDKLFKKL